MLFQISDQSYFVFTEIHSFDVRIQQQIFSEILDLDVQKGKLQHFLSSARDYLMKCVKIMCLYPIFEGHLHRIGSILHLHGIRSNWTFSSTLIDLLSHF